MAKKQGNKAQLGSMWNAARETTQDDASGDFVPVEPGTYVMQLVAAEAKDIGVNRKIWWRWCVVESDNPDDVGLIVHDFEGIDSEDRLVWVQRHLVAMGVDLDACDIDTEDDLVATYQDMIDNLTCARVKVTEKDGWRNVRVQKVVDTYEDVLVDPNEALKGDGGNQSAKRSDADEDDADEEAVDVGARVTWDDGSRRGEIVDFTDDDESAIVKEDGKRKKLTIAFDDLDLEADDADAGDDDNAKTYAYNEGDEVLALYEGEWYPAVVIEGGDDAIKVRHDADGFEDTLDTSSEVDAKVPSDEDEDDEDEDDGDENVDTEFAKGDSVLFMVKGKERVGEIASINKSKRTARVIESTSGKKYVVNLDDLDFDVD